MSQFLWEQLRKLIAQRIGFYIRQQDLQYFQHKIEARTKELKLTNLGDYYKLLNTDEIKTKNLPVEQKRLVTEEWKTLANIITNGESFFFRDRGQFDLLANQILPEVIANKREAYQKGKLDSLSLKIWSAGCSTGEEVYSLAMLISELIPDISQWQIKIIGTDINQKFLDLARQGIYKKWSFRLTDSTLKTKYFLANQQYWQIRPYLKNMVTFYYDNLVDVKTISHRNYDLDLVLCRNVFIYFNLDSIIKAVTKIASTLRYGGYLVTGHAELQAINLNNFQPISFSQSVVYKYVDKQQHPVSILQPNLIEQNTIINCDSLPKQPEKILIFSQKKLTIPIDPDKKIREFQSPQFTLEAIKKLLDRGKYDLVIEQAQQLIQQQKSDRELYYLIAQAYANQGNLELAQENCDRALELDSMYVDPLFLLAQIAEEKNNYQRAKELLKRIIYLEPLSVNAYIELAAIYNSVNETQRAKKMYRAAYELLQKLPPNDIIGDLKQARVRDLLNYVKHQI